MGGGGGGGREGREGGGVVGIGEGRGEEGGGGDEEVGGRGVVVIFFNFFCVVEEEGFTKRMGEGEVVIAFFGVLLWFLVGRDEGIKEDREGDDLESGERKRENKMVSPQIHHKNTIKQETHLNDTISFCFCMK